jgi:cyclopropane fatty-acyl-phospholipid synthase-like methyltransferase
MTSTKRAYFEEMYEGDNDPWGFETRPYERRKYALTVASLPEPHYGAVYEPGCSIGVMTELLAQRCDRLLASDIIPTALDAARQRLLQHKHVRLELRPIPEAWPTEVFDLVVLSEIAYYFDQVDLQRVMTLVRSSIRAGSHVVGVHWRGETDYPLTGDQAHHIIGASPWLRRVVAHQEPEFVLDVWECTR